MIQLTFSSNFYWNVCVKFCTLEQIIATVVFICIFSTNDKRSMLRFQSTTAPTKRGWSTCAVIGTVSSESFTRISLYSFWSDWKFLNDSIFIYLMLLLNLFLSTVSPFGEVVNGWLLAIYCMRFLKFKWVATHQSNLYWKRTTSLKKSPGRAYTGLSLWETVIFEIPQFSW